MKYNPTRKSSVTEPLLKDLMNRQKAESKQTLSEASVGSKPLSAPDLYQDAGGGYNRNFTFPQE